ncbi:hypothetical protein FACS1894170_04680 [Planctomycetales bacterium]|nr:hypothetical protein FACS1894170_04680 [Planctomycetales bacterium]
MSDIFDQKRIKRLIELMKENDLVKLDIQQGDVRVQLERPSEYRTSGNEHRFYEPQSIASPPAVVPAQPQPFVPDAPVVPSNSTEIKSPMVGTFYTASNPDTPPFVKVGDYITAEQTICLIEAMKVYNEIQAECSGKIIAVLASNGDAVEFGQPLFRIEKS